MTSCFEGIAYSAAVALASALVGLGVAAIAGAEPKAGAIIGGIIGGLVALGVAVLLRGRGDYEKVQRDAR